MIPKKIKYNLHYDDVRGDILRPPQRPENSGTFKFLVCKALLKSGRVKIMQKSK